MPPSIDDRLKDIVEMATKIDRITFAMSKESFAKDEIVRGATERFLGIACEASLRLPVELKQQQNAIDWRAMNDFANVLCHGYHAVDVARVWSIVQNDLPKLKAFAERALVDRGQD